MNASETAVRVPAKINLSLGVGPVREDGFHPLATVYQAIGVYDEIVVRPSDSWSLKVVGDERLPLDDVPTDDTNLAMRAARLLADHHEVDQPVEMVVRKGIPVAGGMAGGSADAAAALVACDALWGTHTSRTDLMALAARLGSDVPFLLVGGTAIGSGRGEQITPVMTRGTYWWVVAESGEGLSTPEVYREFDRLHAGAVVAVPEIPDAVLTALGCGDVAGLGQALVNDLEPAALRLRPELRHRLEDGLESSAHAALVSGSGPSCLFLCESEEHAQHVALSLDRHGNGPVSCAPGPVPGARVIR